MRAILAVMDPPKMLPSTSRFLHRGRRPGSSVGPGAAEGCPGSALSWAAARIFERWSCRVAEDGWVTYRDLTS